MQIDVTAIYQEMRLLEHGDKKPYIQNIAASLGLSAATLYRRINNIYGKQKTIEREFSIPQELIDAIAKLKMQGAAMGMKEKEISTELCIKILQDKQVTGSENLTVSTVNRRLRGAGFRQRKKIVRVEAEYPNQQHQLDFSRSKYFQLWKRQGDDFILKVHRSLSYKEDDQKLRTWLVCAVDAFSRVGIAAAYAATGESINIGLQFLNYLYTRKEDENPLIYLPEVLKTDNGAFGKSTAVKNMLKALEIKQEFVRPYEKHGIQKAEALWNLLWQRFELPLAIKVGNGKTLQLSEYNELLTDWCVKNLKAAHPVKALTKEHVYRSHLTLRPQRKVNKDLHEIIFKTWPRTVKQDCTITIKEKEKIDVVLQAPVFAIDQRIVVYTNWAGEFVGELVDSFHKPFKLQLVEGSVKLGDFTHRQHATYKDRLEAEIKKETAQEKEEEKKSTFYIPAREEEFKPETKFREAEEEAEEFTDVWEAKENIASRLRQDWNDALEREFGGLLQKTLCRKGINKAVRGYNDLIKSMNI